MSIQVRKSCLISATFCTVALLASAAGARDLTAVGWGGPRQERLRTEVYEPYGREIGQTVRDDTWDGGIGVLRTKTATGDSGWDVVQVESDELELGCLEGILMPLDMSRLPAPESYVDGAVHECGIGANVYNFVLGYDETKFPEGPSSWADFFDTTTYPGKRGLRQGPKTNLEIALMADGVAPQDVYAVLSTPEGLDRAFAKLDTIKPSLVFWKNGSQPAQMLAAGDVAMTSGYHSRLGNAVRQDSLPIGITWNESLSTLDSWVILSTSPNVDMAYELLGRLSDPAIQANLANFDLGGPPLRAATDMVDPENAPYLPSYPDNAQNTLMISAPFWIDHIDMLNDRWAAWSAN